MSERTKADMLINQEVQWRKAAQLLTEGERSKNITHRRVLAGQVLDLFEEWDYPDWWSRLTRLEDDTAHMERMQSSW